MADGYGVGLFDSSGPKKFATEVKGIATELGAVQSGFTNFGEQATRSLGTISTALDALIAKLGQVQSGLTAGMGGAAPPAAGPTAGPQWSPGAAPQPDAKTGAAPPQAGMEPGTAAKAKPSSNFLSMQQGTASTMGQRAIQSMVPAAVGAATSYAGGMMGTAIQGATIGQGFAPAFGVSSRSLYVMPGGTLAQNPGDYAAANYYAMMNMGVAPGTPNWSTLQQGGNQMMTLLPGLNRQQSFADINAMQQPQVLGQQLMFGFNFSPNGQMMSPTQQYASVFQRLSQQTGGKPTGAQVEQFLRPGGAWNAWMSALGWQPGSDQYQGFVTYALQQVGMNNLGQKMTPGSLAGTPIAGTPAMTQLQAQSAKSQVETQAEPALAQAANLLNEAAKGLLQAVNPLASVFGGGAFGGGTAGLMGGGMSTLGGIGATYIGGKVLGKVGGSMIRGIGGKLPGKVGTALGNVGKKSGGGLLRGLFGGGAEAAGGAAAEEGTVAAATGLEGAGIAADATGIGLPIGIGLGVAGLAVGFGPAIARGIGSLFGGHKKKSTAAPDGSSTGGVSGDVASLLNAAPPPNSLIASLTSTVTRGDNSLISSLVYGAPASGGTGGTQATLMSATTGGGWNYQGGGIGPGSVSGMFAGGTSGASGAGGGGGGSGGTGASGGATKLTGSSNAQKVYNFLIGKGLKDYQAAAVVGNFAQESNVNPSTPGGGIAQWIGSRWTNLVALAKQENKPPTDLGVQLDYLWNELTGSEAGSLAALKASTDVISATQAFESNFERAGDPQMQNRIKYAQNALKSKGSSYARGSQLIARTQLATLHRGESVITAADSYSANPYNKNGAVGSSTTVALNFGAGSVVLQVPPNSSAQDMENMANQFVAAISKPQVLAAVRST